MTSVAEPDVEQRIRTVVFLPCERKDCVAAARTSFEDYLRLDVEGLTEWVDGEVRLYMSVSDEHQRVVNLLSVLLTVFSDARRLGVVRTASYAMRALPGGPGREPDLVFIRDEHRDRLLSSHLAGPPDLAVEVVIPDSAERDYVEKFREYEAAGIPEYWIIDARLGKERADFFVLRDGRYVAALPEAGVYRSTVVEGFWLRVEWLWDPSPRMGDALREILGQPLA
jgi:Uma2 family endonuclease